MTRPPAFPFRLEKRSLRHLAGDLAVFGHYRVVNQVLPPVIRMLVNVLFFGAGLVGLAAAGWLMAKGQIRQEVVLGLISSLAFFLFGALGIWSWRRKRRLHRAQVEVCKPGYYLVRFEKAGQAVKLIGPVGEEDDPVATVEPEVLQAPLNMVSQKKLLIPPWPWSDIEVDTEDREYLSWTLKFQETGMLDLDLAFDLTDGIEPDLRWYIHKDNPEVLRRARLVDQLLD